MGRPYLGEAAKQLSAYLRLMQNIESMPSGCNEWRGPINHSGYGRFGVGKKGTLAHRFAYQWYVGDPGELCVCHKCDNRKCVNPEHLFLGTRADNQADMKRKGRGRATGAPGELNNAAKLRAADVDRIRALYPTMNQYEIAGRFGMSQAQIGRILRGESWRTL